MQCRDERKSGHAGHALFDNLTGEFVNPGLCNQPCAGSLGIDALTSRFQMREGRLAHLVVIIQDCNDAGLVSIDMVNTAEIQRETYRDIQPGRVVLAELRPTQGADLLLRSFAFM